MKTVAPPLLALVLVLVLAPAALAAGAPLTRAPADLVPLTFRLTLDGDVPPGETFTVQYGDTQQEQWADLPLCGAGADRLCRGGGVYTRSVALPRGAVVSVTFFRRSDRVRDGGGLIGCCIQPFGGGRITLDRDRTVAASYDFGWPGGAAVDLTFQVTIDGDLPPGQLVQLVVGEARRDRGVPRAQAILCAPFQTPCSGHGWTYTVSFPAGYGYVAGQTIGYRFHRYRGGQVYEGGPPEEVFGEGTVTLTGATTIRAVYTFTQQCFAETGQCVEGRFLAYWRAHGGLAINGFPLTDLRYEELEDGRFYQVQYFERVRMEYHPENSPPHDVLLGQFGRRIFRERTGREVDPPAAPLPGQAYFAETGHNLGDGFLAYWQRHGGLMQFGYPLGEVFEEQLEDGRRYRVQYFERARFEYHPENNPPYDILLGQFGRRILAAVDAGR